MSLAPLCRAHDDSHPCLGPRLGTSAVGRPLQEVDLRDLFSFDKLRASERVSVITTEEFIEKEALSGNLGIWPSENVMRLDEKVRSYCL